MKISIVSGFFLPVPAVQGGAAEKIWHRLAQEFAAAGHQVTHLSRRWPTFPNREIKDGIEYLRVPGFRHTASIRRNLLLDAIWGCRIARRLPPGDIVACNTVVLPIFLRYVRPGAGKVVAVLGRMPKGQTKAYGAVDLMLATSEAVREQVLRESPRAASRTRVMYNPLDWDLHHRASAQGRRLGALTIGYVGRMNPEKGLEILLAAAARLHARTDLPPWRLRLIGPQTVADGGGGEAYVASLRALIPPGAPVVLDPPIYSPQKLAAVYGELDVFCYPSLADKGEGLSVAPLEAMAAGAVPVVSNLACYRDVMVPERNSLVFDRLAPDREQRLADHLAWLLTHEEGRRRLAAEASATARRFDYGAIARRVLGDFDDLLASKKG